MAQPNGNSPQFAGPVSAQSFQTTGVPHSLARTVVQTVAVTTDGTTEVGIFGDTNPFSGTFYGARIISKDDANGTITLQHTSAGTVLFSLAKGSAGAMKGSALAPTSFAYGGTATVKSSGTGNVLVEIDFIVSNPALPGAQ